MRFTFFISLILCTQLSIAQATKTIQFYAKDSVRITADTYFLKDVAPTVLLCHQAGYSRGEYIETAKKLNELGFSCMAIDQRSGKEVNGIKNETALDASKKIMNIGFAGAKVDLETAINYLYNINGGKKIILVGSSYSACLSLWIAGERNKKVKAVAAFSPGEYLKGRNLAELIKPIKIPVFVTSSKRETKLVTELMRYVKPKYVTQYKTTKEGIHGSRALWETTDDSKAYWNAFKKFMLVQKD